MKNSLLSFILGSVVKSFTKTQDCKGLLQEYLLYDVINTDAICNTKITMKMLETVQQYVTLCLHYVVYTGIMLYQTCTV